MKIPFERTIAGAYRFAFANILSILGIGWFPFLLVGLLVAGLAYSLLPQLNALLTMDPHRPDSAEVMRLVLPLAGALPLLFAATLVATAMVNVGIIRKALGQHPGPVFIFFSLGSQVWRMIGAYFLLLLLVWGVVIAMTLGIGGVSFLLSKISPGAQAAGTALLICIAIVWGIYAVVRVQFFLPVVVVAENHIGIRRSWHLGRGNFWRIIGIVLAVSLPVGIVVSTITQVMIQMAIGPQLVHMTGWSASPGHTVMTPDELRHNLSTLFSALGSVWPYLAAVELLHVVLLTGLTAGAIANAYNLVTGGPDVAPQSGSTKAPI